MVDRSYDFTLDQVQWGAPRPAAVSVAAAPKGPYTYPDEQRHAMSPGIEREDRITALDRKLTEGFNLLHARLDVQERDIREIRTHLVRQDERIEQRFVRQDERIEQRLAGLEERMERRFADQEEARRADTAEIRQVIGELKAQVQTIAEQSATALERSAGFAWTRRRVVVGLFLLVAGGLLAEFGRQVVAAFASG